MLSYQIKSTMVLSCVSHYFFSEKYPLDILDRSLNIITPQAFLPNFCHVTHYAQKHLVVVNMHPRTHQKTSISNNYCSVRLCHTNLSYLFGMILEFRLGAILINDAQLLERKSKVIWQNSLIFVRVVLFCHIFGSWNEKILIIREDLS